MHLDELYNHESASLSALDLQMVRAIPPGGNWQNIPDEIVAKSKRLQQIRRTGGRTTYYGRMVFDKPSYTISTYFNRPGNGCFIHPTQDRLITQREAARLQSFPDWFRFYGSKLSRYQQIGNAVPPLLARAIASGLKGKNFIDLFAGAGGLAIGFESVGFECLLAVDIDKNMCQTLRNNHVAEIIHETDLSNENTVQTVVELAQNRLRGKQLDLIVAGPPCQGFSTAGNWNHDDPRNNLYKPLIQIVKSLLPRYVLIENVLGIRLMRRGEVLKKIEELLRETGYAVKTELLKAEEYGVPQKRRRIFVFGSLKSEEWCFPPEPLFAASKEVRFGSDGQILFLPSPLTVNDALSDLPAVEPGGGAEVMKYDDSWIRSDYQRWARGHIGFDELYKNVLQRSNKVMGSYLRQKEQVDLH